MIVKLSPGKWTLFSKDGKKILGTHRTQRAAKAQEVAIHLSKARLRGGARRKK